MEACDHAAMADNSDADHDSAADTDAGSAVVLEKVPSEGS